MGGNEGPPTPPPPNETPQEKLRGWFGYGFLAAALYTVTDEELMASAGVDALALTWLFRFGIEVFGILSVFRRASLPPYTALCTSPSMSAAGHYRPICF